MKRQLCVAAFFCVFGRKVQKYQTNQVKVRKYAWGGVKNEKKTEKKSKKQKIY